MHEGGRGINVHGCILVRGGHLEVVVIFRKVVRVGVVLGVVGDGRGEGVEVVVAEDPDEAPVAGGTDDASRRVADHGGGVCARRSEEHGLGVVVAVEAMEEGEEDGVGGVGGDVLEVHAGKVGSGEEGDVGGGMLEDGAVGRDNAIGGAGHDERRRVQD